MVKKAKQKENAKRKKAAAKSPVVSAAVVNKPSKRPKSFDKVYNAPKKSGWQKFVEYLKKRPIVAFMIVFLVLGAGFVAFNQYQIYQEKKDFEQAEIVLDEIANSIADSLGKPLKTEKEKFCSYRSVKFVDPGSPNCSVSNTLTYESSLLDENNIETLELLVQSSDKIDINKGELLNSFKDGDKYNKYSVADSDFSIVNSSLKCFVSLSKNLLQEELTTIKISCYLQESTREYYPVVE